MAKWRNSSSAIAQRSWVEYHMSVWSPQRYNRMLLTTPLNILKWRSKFPSGSITILEFVDKDPTTLTEYQMLSIHSHFSKDKWMNVRTNKWSHEAWHEKSQKCHWPKTIIIVFEQQSVSHLHMHTAHFAYTNHESNLIFSAFEFIMSWCLSCTLI